MTPRLARLLRLLRSAAVAAVVLGAALGAPAAAQHAFGRNKVQYDDFDWHVLRTAHFDVYYYDEARELAAYGAAFAEEVYEELEHRFDFSLGQRVPLIFYSSNLHFKQTNTTDGFIPDGVGGFFEFLKGRVVVPCNGDLHRFRRVIRHELVHVFTFNKLTRVRRDHRTPNEVLPPLWFTEGLAEYWSGEPDYLHEMMLRDAVASNYLVPLDDLDRIAGSYLMYKQGEAVCRFIAETYGEEKLLELVENTWRDVSFTKVMRHVLREPLHTTSDRWSAWMREQYLPKLEDAAPPSLLSEPVVRRGFSAKPAFWRHPDGTPTVLYVGNRDGYSNVYRVELDSAMTPAGSADVIIAGERGAKYEAFHLFESRIDVSPGGVLAFVTQSGGADVVHTYDLVGERAGPTYRFPGLVAIYSPTWDPAGERLAFTGIARSGFADLYVYDARRDALRQLTRDTYDDRDPDWSPDGRRLVFSSDRTALGEGHAYNLFTYDLADDRIAYLTYGPQHDLSPRWSPDGRRVAFTSTRREADGKFSAQDLWALDVDTEGALAAAGAEAPAPERRAYRLTNATSATYDPAWTDTGHLLFGSMEAMRFTIRQVDADSLLAAPVAVTTPAAPEPGTWAFDAVADVGDERSQPYRRRYALDFATGALSTNPVLGASGGAVLVFSDLLGDDRWLVSTYAVRSPGRSFAEGLNATVARYHLGRRANFGYGAFRVAGPRYDRADPDVVESGLPYLYEQLLGGFGLVQYPLSKFQRLELQTSLAWSLREQIVERDREAVLLSNGVGFVHDNALYGMNGPVAGWRTSVGAAYTTDVYRSHVSYYTLSADLRTYFRLIPDVTFASRAFAQTNVGREARYALLGGSWDLRGFPLLGVRGRNAWFTSHELRFPLLHAPSAWIPVLAPFGIANLRGAAFADAAHVWNDAYTSDAALDRRLFAGRTLGAVGLGLRMNLFGGIVLRYDFGWRFRDGLDWYERDPFRQFFFGWDF